MVEFSAAGYSKLLSAFKDSGYFFCGFEEIDSCLSEGHPFIVLRHDVDISLRPALEIARLEYEQGLRATYFVLLRSPFYNAFSRPHADLILQIHQYGHQIATHIDLAAYDNDLARALVEVDIFSTLYPFVNTRLVSLHSASYDLEHTPIGISLQLNNVYGHAVRGEISYVSDSTGRWRYGHPLDSEAFKTRKPIQLLTHPEWWIQQGETATQKLERLLYSDYQNSYAILKEFMPKLYRLDGP